MLSVILGLRHFHLHPSLWIATGYDLNCQYIGVHLHHHIHQHSSAFVMQEHPARHRPRSCVMLHHYASSCFTIGSDMVVIHNHARSPHISMRCHMALFSSCMIQVWAIFTIFLDKIVKSNDGGTALAVCCCKRQDDILAKRASPGMSLKCDLKCETQRARLQCWAP